MEQLAKYKKALNFMRRNLKGEVLLDLGCGTGLFVNFASKKINILYYIGLDLSYIAALKCKERIAHTNVMGDVIVADILHIPIRMNFKFDIIISFSVIHLFSDEMIKTIKCYVKVGSIVILTLLKKFSHRINKLLYIIKCKLLILVEPDKVKDIIVICYVDERDDK